MNKITYEQTGVSLEKADMLSDILSQKIDAANFKSFAGIYEHPHFADILFAATTDGVGTKVIPLIENGMYETLALDLIAMNLNDLACVGARPMFFLDYIATNSINLDVTANFLVHLKNNLSKFGCALLGGETSELGEFIKPGFFDVAGFAVGLLKKNQLLAKENVKSGDLIIGLKSSGPHSNGFSLIRKLHSEGFLDEADFEKCLAPTNIYINEVLNLVDKGLLAACANITGGGIKSNLSRIIPSGLIANVDTGKIPENPVFTKLLSLVGQEEAYKAFNMGVGFVLIVKKENKEEVFQAVKAFEPFELGQIEENENFKENIDICFG